MSMQAVDENLNFLILKLSEERKEKLDRDVFTFPFAKRFNIARAYMNLRPAKSLSEEVVKAQNLVLSSLIKERGIVDIFNLSEKEKGISLFQGDIMRLNADVIVNAANSAAQGCFIPGHNCIDNVIHTFAGMQLRLYCHDLIKKRNKELFTGEAIITPGFNLPARYVIHTVGPIIFVDVNNKKKEELRSCYLNSMNLALENKCKSIVFPCISTGEFHFPQKEAAIIAIACVREFLKAHDYPFKVVFNVFKDSDLSIYTELLGTQ